MIDFNRPPYTGNELKYIAQAVEKHKICGDGTFTYKCSSWIKNEMGCNHVLLTTSCTHALEMAAFLSDIQPGDEVIMPSYTFVSTANAFVLRGAKIVFIDIHPKTMNMDENCIEAAISSRTKAIVPVHYAGIACKMDKILDIAKERKLTVIEDAAQGVNAWYKGQALGTIGDFGCFSFHETKNYSMGEGGALLFNNDNVLEKAEILREKGTNRSKFFRGEIDKYTWVDYGSSYLPSDINAAYLWAQLENAAEINSKRLWAWNYYYEAFKTLEEKECVELPYIPENCIHNAHMFYLKVRNLEVRTKFIDFLKKNGVQAVFHYVPLHSSPAGKKFGCFCGRDRFTTLESERLVRLPLFYAITKSELDIVIDTVYTFFASYH